MREVFVAAAGTVPVGKHPLGAGRALAREAGRAALADAGIDFTGVDALYCGVAMPASPRAVAVAKEFGLTGLPVVQITNASASGLAAVHQAMMAIESGRHDVVMVLGYDAPDWDENPLARQGFLPPPALFAMWARRRMHDHGSRSEHLAMVTAKNWNYARTVPYAARRSDHEVGVDEVLASRMVAEPLTTMMCTSWVFGAAAVILASRKGLERLPGARWPMPRIAASEWRTEVYEDYHIFEGAIVGPPAISRTTFDAAMTAAGRVRGEVDVVQIHDAFAIEELEYYELFGFVEPGGAEALLEQGAFGPGSRARTGLPEFSTDGGLIGRGHPAGPSGVLQLIETRRRFRDCGDRVGVCHLLGAGSSCIVQVLDRVDE
ncbi:thiolase family protein [Celeribacter indicus]|uniref:Thiolase n=1 Tax=Celeribacter indicus TaxID=1208324 RepID=A0A0B5DWF2_9RHOB|nr:thiolase family protein [Celeribacter indicus]AJE45056.1 thiolase [Celeribacter indicus]SDX42267.1 Acetyl-CoA acetyltransferase [Celeribacter indicus]